MPSLWCVNETYSNASLNFEDTTISEQATDENDSKILNESLDKINNSATVDVRSIDKAGHMADWLSAFWGISFPV